MRYLKPWVRTFEIWAVIAALVVGSYGFGFVVATTQDRAARAAELSVNSGAFNAALAAKDKLIFSLAHTTVQAAGQAADAMATAADAAEVSTKKSEADAAEMVKLKKNQKPRGCCG